MWARNASMDMKRPRSSASISRDFTATRIAAPGGPEKALATAARDGRFKGEGWRLRKDGTKFWASVIIDCINDPRRNLVGFAEITRDLTERRAAEASLRHSEEQFRRLVQGVTDYSIFLLEPDGRVATWNAGAQRIKGYRPDEIIGEHFSRFYTEEDRQNGEPEKALETAIREGRFEKEGWRVRKNGERFWANVVIDSIYDDTGQLAGFAKITRDITERRDAQLAVEDVHVARRGPRCWWRLDASDRGRHPAEGPRRGDGRERGEEHTPPDPHHRTTS